MTDPLTGLPELPKGYFWRIAESVHFSTPRIELRKRGRFWSQIEASSDIYMDWVEDGDHISSKTSVEFDTLAEGFTVENIRKTASCVNGRWLADNAAQLAYQDTKRFYGDYPPMRLGEDDD